MLTMDYSPSMSVDWAYLNVDMDVKFGAVQCNSHQETTFFTYDEI